MQAVSECASLMRAGKFEFFRCQPERTSPSGPSPEFALLFQGFFRHIRVRAASRCNAAFHRAWRGRCPDATRHRVRRGRIQAC